MSENKIHYLLALVFILPSIYCLAAYAGVGTWVGASLSFLVVVLYIAVVNLISHRS